MQHRSIPKNGGWGYVIQDSAGSVLHAGAGAVQNAMDALHVEVTGVVWLQGEILVHVILKKILVFKNIK